MKIADIIDLAINRHLWQGDEDYRLMREYEYSCEALCRVCQKKVNDRIKFEAFLTPMGVQCRGISEQFKGIPAGPKRQYARALWLTWAAMIAREEGV